MNPCIKLSLVLIVFLMLPSLSHHRTSKIIKKVQKFLEKYEDYNATEAQNDGNGTPEEVCRSEKFQRALKKMQKFAGLVPTGELDDLTLKMIYSSRCGDKDGEYRRRNKRGVEEVYRWPTTHLINCLRWENPTDISHEIIKEVIANASNEFAKVTPLSFVTDDAPEDPMWENFECNIVLYFHGEISTCPYPFDGPAGTLAHAFLPTHGQIHFDETEEYTLDIANLTAYDLMSIVLHEIGHALGLEHSQDNSSIMFPYYQNNMRKLTDIDINAIQNLYGDNPSSQSQQQGPLGISQDPEKTAKSSRKNREKGKGKGSKRKGKGKHSKRKGKDSKKAAKISKGGVSQARISNQLCLSPKFDTIFQISNETYYIFKKNLFWTVDLSKSERLSEPKLIKDHWPGLESDIDAGFLWPQTGHTYIFKQDKYWKFKNHQPLNGYPRKFGEIGFYNIPTNLDSVFVHPSNGMVYFTKNSSCWRSDVIQNKNLNKYPKSLKDIVGTNELQSAIEINGTMYNFNKGVSFYSWENITNSTKVGHIKYTKEFLGCSLNEIEKDTMTKPHTKAFNFTEVISEEELRKLHEKIEFEFSSHSSGNSASLCVWKILILIYLSKILTSLFI